MRKLFSIAAIAALLGACSQEPAAPEADVEVAPVSNVDHYAQAVANENRLEADYDRDANRKPDQVLEFFGVEPGMQVLDMFSGGGYYSELMANVVGADGHVDAHSNKAYLQFVGDEFNARHDGGRLSNVAVLWAENNELALDAGKYDAIMLVLSYHDIYFTDGGDSWATIDGPKLLAELHKGLKDDGFIGVIDHAAAPGSGTETGNTVHRIDRAIVIAEMEAAGFVVDAESDLLRNPEDDHSVGVFDPSIRGNTDRFILRFKKSD